MRLGVGELGVAADRSAQHPRGDLGEVAVEGGASIGYVRAYARPVRPVASSELSDLSVIQDESPALEGIQGGPRPGGSVEDSSPD